VSAVEVLVMVAGIIVLALTEYDIFQSIVLPRPSVRKVQLARPLVRSLWVVWRWVAQRSSRVDKSEGRMAVFGPVALILLVLIWATALVFGYAMVLYGLRDEFRPLLIDFPDAFYVSATTLVPLAYGDLVPQLGPARFVIIVESANGVAYAALAITLLFELYGSFREREQAVVALDAIAGAPASGVQLLETAAHKGMRGILADTFEEWRKWSAMVLESHLAYPLLFYFRSSHDNEAWINSFGAVMDASSLVLSSMEDGEEFTGAAKLMMTVGNHLIEDTAWVFNIQSESDPIIEREEYVTAVARLRAAGYDMRDGEEHWQKFAKLRGKYAFVLNRMAQWLATPPAPWVGDRSYLPHRQQRRRRPAASKAPAN